MDHKPEEAAPTGRSQLPPWPDIKSLVILGVVLLGLLVWVAA
jgi:hypothetical protein